MEHSSKKAHLLWDSNSVCPDKNPMFYPLNQRVDSLTQLSEIEYIPTSYAKSAKADYRM